MTGNQFQELLRRYGLRHADVADMLDVGVRTVERYVAAKKVSRVVEYALLYAIKERGLKPLT